ncbi:MAG: histidinol-phosphate transaminase [Kiritimatiellae bacterium]|nr:histidinol-phosphate transaminase [Kiritimatiellia bacterium]
MSALIRNCIRKMSAYVPGEQPADPAVIKLNTNENPYPPSPAVMKALQKIDGDMLRRYPDPECKELRAVIARLHKCSAENVFVGNGSDEILALCSRAFAEDNDQIAFFEPSYSLYPVLARIRNVRSRIIRPGKNFQWRMPVDCKAGLFYMTNPNAPTGALYPGQEVARFCRRFAGVVVLDEAYVDFARENCMHLALKLKNILALRTLSKSYSLAGLRVGYAVGARELVAALFKIKDSYNVDRISQALAMAALKDQAYMRANARRIIASRRRLSGSLAALGFTVLPSDANFVFAKPSGSAATLYRRLRARNILVRHFAGRKTGDFLRITVGTDRQINALLKAIPAIRGDKERGE